MVLPATVVDVVDVVELLVDELVVGALVVVVTSAAAAGAARRTASGTDCEQAEVTAATTAATVSSRLWGRRREDFNEGPFLGPCSCRS